VVLSRPFSGGRKGLEPPTHPVSLASAPAVPPRAPATSRGLQKLGEVLVHKDLLTQAQLSEALLQQSESGKRIGTLLVELGLIDERDVVLALAEQLHLEMVDLGKVVPDPEALALLPQTLARSLMAIPVRIHSGQLEIAIADPSDQEAADRLRQAAGQNVRLLIAPPSEIRRAIDNSYRALSGIESQIKAFEATAASRKVELSAMQSVSEDAPVVKVVNAIVTQGLRDRASDIHIEPQEDRLRIRYRIDGALHDVLALPASMAGAVVSRLKIMAGMNIVERMRPQDGQIALTIDSREVDIRVATTATIRGEKAVLRLLDKSKPLFRLRDLGMAPDVNETYSKLIRSPFGMVICTGPTGSGKTTTLYATLSEVNHSERNIMTIEDPVEYIFPSINQIQIREQSGITFAGGLKSILRQDPDVILVGEMRDAETARIAVQSALTGHFVLSSLHATDAASALTRLLDMGIEEFLIASSVIGIVGQRLLRRTCRACRVPYQPSSEEMAFYQQSGGKPKQQFFHGEGCNFCTNTGYQERIGVYELLKVTDEIKSLLVGHASHDELRTMAIRQGMRPMREEAIRLAGEDVTTISEVIRSIYTV
jgi:type IV pilus assembly protein PilB